MEKVALAIVCVIFATLFSVGINRSEVMDCYKWQKQAKEYSSFYILRWQAAQCVAHGIQVDAPIEPALTQ